MPTYFAHESRAALLDEIRVANNTDWEFGLFKSDLALTDVTTWLDIQPFEADYSGYAPLPAVFAGSFLDGLFVANSVAPSQVFTHNGGGTANMCYGWFLLHVPTLKLRFSGKFPLGKQMAFSADGIVLDPTLLLDKG